MLRISRQALRTAEEYDAYIAERYTPNGTVATPPSWRS